MAIGWNFPSNNYGTLNGIGEAGIETFKGTPYRSLAREICQNSLDARMSEDKPVIVEFSYCEIPRSAVWGYSELKDAIESCLDFWKKQKNKKTVDFFRKAVKVVRQETIPVLRISDFNTTGLLGSAQDYNTPWQNLVKASGVSDKEDGLGGSFGIGKSAPFACSDLRCVFYSTKDKEGAEASQGIARLVSFAMKDHAAKNGFFKKEQDALTTGIGYYGEMVKNRAIPEWRTLDRGFCRKKTGTDVFVLGFKNQRDWEKEIIASALDDFLISIFFGFLAVKVGETIISKKTLPRMVEEFKEIAPMAYNYYQVLVSPDTDVREEDYGGLGAVKLYILVQNGLHRRILMSRSNGMKVFDQKNFPSAIQFAGICILKDRRINSYFKEMENPRHDAWEPERHSKPGEAKKMRQGLFRYMKEAVLELGRKTTAEAVDAEGMGEYLPDEEIPADGAENHEDIADTTKTIDLNLSSLQYGQKGFESAPGGQDESTADEMGESENMDLGGNGSKDYGEEQPNMTADGEGYGAGTGMGPGVSGNGANPVRGGEPSKGEKAKVRKRVEVHTMCVRLILLDEKKNRYRLSFIPEQTVGDAYLELKLSGEQSNLEVNVSQAADCATKEKLVSKDNLIYMQDIAVSCKRSVEFNLDYAEKSSLEVSLYGYKA